MGTKKKYNVSFLYYIPEVESDQKINVFNEKNVSNLLRNSQNLVQLL